MKWEPNSPLSWIQKICKGETCQNVYNFFYYINMEIMRNISKLIFSHKKIKMFYYLWNTLLYYSFGEAATCVQNQFSYFLFIFPFLFKIKHESDLVQNIFF